MCLEIYNNFIFKNKHEGHYTDSNYLFYPPFFKHTHVYVCIYTHRHIHTHNFNNWEHSEYGLLEI